MVKKGDSLAGRPLTTYTCRTLAINLQSVTIQFVPESLSNRVYKVINTTVSYILDCPALRADHVMVVLGSSKQVSWRSSIDHQSTDYTLFLQ